MHFFSELCPFFFTFYPDFLSSIKHPTAEDWHPRGTLVLANLSELSANALNLDVFNPFPHNCTF